MLSVKTLRGASWSVAARMSSRIIDLVTLLALARVLTPTDFGLTAIAMSIVSIVDMIFEVPLVQALMRLQSIEKRHLDTAFTIGVIRGVIIALLMATAAWPISQIYADARLFPIITVLAVGPIARSISSPTMVYYFKRMDFRLSFVADFIGKIAAAIISIIVMYAGGGYWALVINTITSALLPTALSYILSPYRPNFSLSKLKDFTAFTGWFTSSQILAAFSWQYDRIFLGYNVEKSVIGRYSLASDFAVLPTQSLIGPAMRPVMAAFTTMSDDHRRLQLAFLKAARLTMAIALPAGLGISLTADLIVEIILGQQWSAAAEYLQWLSLAIVFTAYYQPVSSLCLAVDRPNILLMINTFETVTKIILMTAGFFIGGLSLMLYARVAVALLQLLISALYIRHVIDISVSTQLLNLWQISTSGIVMAAAVLTLRSYIGQENFGLIGSMMSMAIGGSIVYAGCMHVCGFRMRSRSQ